jgi:hypothetical protein
MRRLSAEKIKNYRTVALNLVKSSLDYTRGKDEPVYQVFQRTPPTTAIDFYARLKKHATHRLIDEKFNANQLMAEWVGLGVNPIDMVLPTLRMTHPYDGLGAMFVPGIEFDDEADPHSFYPQFLQEVTDLDALLERSLSCGSYPALNAENNLGLPLTHPKARLFAFMMAGDVSLPYLTHSALMQECLPFWFAELREADREYRQGASDFFMSFGDHLPKRYSKPDHPFCEAYNQQLSGFLLAMSNGFSTVDLDFKFQNSLTVELTRENALKVEPGLLRNRVLSNCLNDQQKQQFCSDILATRCYDMIKHVMQILYPIPELFAEVLRGNEVPEKQVQFILRHCLGSDVYFGYHTDKLTEMTLKVEALRHVLKDVGYQDIKGTWVLDGLALDLDLGEAFEARGYLRHEDMGLGKSFASFKKEGVHILQGRLINDFMKRKIDLAIRLNQKQTLIDAMEVFFGNKKSFQEDFTTPESVLAILNSGCLDLPSILRNKGRFDKAMKLGLNAELVLDKPGFEKYSAKASDFLARDLGI